MTLSDAGLGDMVLIDAIEYRLMIPLRGGWLCRKGRLGPHEWFDDDQEIEEIVHVQTKANPKARKAKGRGNIHSLIE